MGYNYIPPPSSGSGDSKWMDSPSSPNPLDIELNTTDGVTGVFAPNPFNTKLIQVLTQIGGVDIAGVAGDDGAQQWLRALIQSVGGISSVESFTDSGTGIELSREIDGTQLLSTATDNANKLAHKKHDETEIDQLVEDSGTTDKTQYTQQENQHYIKVFFGGAEVLNILLDKTGFLLEQSPGNPIFKILQDGKIQTNQCAAPGVHATLAKEIEVFDTAGVSQGFIPVFTV